MIRSTVLLAILIALAAPGTARAQSLGTFRWQLQPYCNVLTEAVTQTGSVYRLEGTDDRCGANSDQASVTGVAYPNPEGTIGFGITIVTPDELVDALRRATSARWAGHNGHGTPVAWRMDRARI